MTRVDGVFRRAEAAGLDLVRLLESDPEAGNAELAKLVDATRRAIDDARGSMVYRLAGPEPAKATPMQYGGFFLEKDRELLDHALATRDGAEVWLEVTAGPDAYFDFIADLPADVFAWDARATGLGLAEMRSLRSGRLCTNEPGSDEPFESLGIKEAQLAH